MAKLTNYISDSFNELKNNVTWTEWSDVQRYTIIVTVFTIVFSLFLWGVDTAFEKVLSGFFSLIKG